MTSILDNELVKKYFCDGINHMAVNVLAAMQEPIHRGDKLIELGGALDDYVARITFADDRDFNGWHAYFLRVPDRFQKRECECACHLEECRGKHHQKVICQCGHYGLSPTSDAVEGKIKEIRDIQDQGERTWMAIEKHLRDLVRLAREGKCEKA